MSRVSICLVTVLCIPTVSADVEQRLDELLQRRESLHSGHVIITQSFVVAPEPPHAKAIRKTESSYEVWFEDDYRRIDRTIIGLTADGLRSRGFQQLVVTPTDVILQDGSYDLSRSVVIYPRNHVEGYKADKLAVRPRFLLMSVAHPLPTSITGDSDSQLFGHLYLGDAAPVLEQVDADEVITSTSDRSSCTVRIADGVVQFSEFVSGNQVLRMTINETSEQGYPLDAVYEEITDGEVVVNTEYRTDVLQFNADVPDHIFELKSLGLPAGKIVRQTPEAGVASIGLIWDGEQAVPNPEFQEAPQVSLEQQSAENDTGRPTSTLLIINGVLVFLVLAWLFLRRRNQSV